jgi:serine/threonine protein kinase
VCAQVAHVKAEKETLLHMEHHCIIKLYGTFQDEECVYLVMEYVAGGEFFTHLKQRKK